MSENFDSPPKLPDREDVSEPPENPHERHSSERRVKVSLPEITSEEKKKDETDEHLSLKSVSLGSILSLLQKNASKESTMSKDVFTLGSIKSGASSRKTGVSTPSRSSKSEQISEPETGEVSPLPPEIDDISYAIPEDFIRRMRSSTLSSSIHFVSEEFTKREYSLDMPTIAEDFETLRDEDEYHEDIYIDRKLYIEMYKIFETRKYKEKLKNNYLQSRLAKYYMRRKMFYVLRELTTKVDEVMIKYQKDLESLENLCDLSEREKAYNYEEIKVLTAKRDAKIADLETLFQNLINMEQEFAKTLTFERTGRTNVDKMAERFVKRQKSQANLLIKLRMTYINLRNRFNEKTLAYENLDHLGPGYGIMDYVQLKMDNRKLYDTLEEKESELTKLRLDCKDTIQVLAHNREKSQVVNLDIEKLKEELQVTDTELNDAREQLGYLKRERDKFRDEIKRMRLEFGLLTNPKLLRDMESSIKEINILKDNIEKTKDRYLEKSKQTVAVRKNMERYVADRKREESRILKILESVSSLTVKKIPTLATVPSVGTKKSVSIVDLPQKKSF
ncbi:uncharacterized protein LOC123003547 [Tribolium madens]|uniref:uncharacterized protein LOC123003547 n=1 Tax=Tribolium madens TaxID=41895 RepID=UPI001CF725F9|nr:uncharacterized protein LOC123003547 [Tribolium madens]